MLKSDTDGEWVSPGRAALLLQVSSKTVSRLADDGKLRSIMTNGGHRRVALADVRALIAERQEAAAS